MLAARDAKPPWFAKPEKPPVAVPGACEALCTPLPNALVFAPLAVEFEKPDWPNVAPVDAPPEAQGELLIPSCVDCPNPRELGLPKVGADALGVLPKELEPKVAPPVCFGVVVAGLDGAPHGEDF